MPFNWREPYRVSDQHEQRGSGFLIDEKGNIITSAHVVDEPTIWIQIPAFGQQTFFVDIIGFCPERDLALLRLHEEILRLIESKLGRMPWISLGDSDLVRRTDEIAVSGYPLGQFRIKSITASSAGGKQPVGEHYYKLRHR